MSQRIEKVESLVHQTVATALLQVMGGESANLTVTGVDVSPDLKNANVWIGILMADPAVLWPKVESARGELQKAVAKTLTTKFVPKLHLRQDVGGQYAEHISRVMKGL